MCRCRVERLNGAPHVDGDDGVHHVIQNRLGVFLGIAQLGLRLVFVQRHLDHRAQLALGKRLQDVAKRLGQLGAVDHVVSCKRG